MIIGIDIGGTKIRAVLWDGRKIARSAEVKTPNHQENFAKAVKKIVLAVAGKEKITKIGIGTAGVVNSPSLIVSPNIPAIKHFNFRKLWPLPISLRIDNDARCFAREEYLLGAGKNTKSIFAITIGTGIGRAYGKNGEIQKIKKFEYPEYWEKKYQRIYSAKNDISLAEFLGKNLTPIFTRFKPEVIVIGGGAMRRRGLLKKIRVSLNQRGVVAKIKSSRLEKNAVAVGAILLFNKINI